MFCPTFSSLLQGSDDRVRIILYHILTSFDSTHELPNTHGIWNDEFQLLSDLVFLEHDAPGGERKGGEEGGLDESSQP